MKTLRFALVGAGEFGNFAESVLNQVPGTKLVAVVDTNESAAIGLAKKYNTPCFDNISVLLDKIQVDFVMINTPNDTHFDIVKTALTRGVGVFCEKPLVIKLSQISQLFSLAKPGQLDVDMVLRQASGYQYLKTIIEQNNFLPQSINIENNATESRIQAGWYWDNARSGGWFYTAAIHFLDLLQFLYPQIEFDEIKAYIDVDRNTGRAIGYQCGLRNNQTTVNISHRFDSTDAEVGFEAMFDFGSSSARVKGWVPTEIRWNNIKIAPWQLSTDREVEYQRMVASRLSNFCDGLINHRDQIKRTDITQVSQWCEALQEAATNTPNQWIKF